MKLKMNGKRSLSPSSNHQGGNHQKQWKQFGQNFNGEMMAERKKLPMWAAREGFLKEISK